MGLPLSIYSEKTAKYQLYLLKAQSRFKLHVLRDQRVLEVASQCNEQQTKQNVL